MVLGQINVISMSFPKCIFNPFFEQSGHERELMKPSEIKALHRYAFKKLEDAIRMLIGT